MQNLWVYYPLIFVLFFFVSGCVICYKYGQQHNYISQKEQDRKLNLILVFIHMFFNILWPLFFFRLDWAIFSVIWLILMIASACIVMYRYFYTNLPAGIIFNIYTLWLIYALYLNLGLVLINF